MTPIAKTAIVMVACAAAVTSASAQTKKKSKPAPAAVETVAVPKALVEAEEAIGKKDYARAESLLLEVTGKDPKDYRAWYDLGFVFQATNRMQPAVDAYKKSVALKPDEAATNLALGRLLILNGQSAEAVKYISQAARLKPSGSTWLLLAHALEPSDPAAAVDAYKKAVAASPRDPEPNIRLGAFLESEKRFGEAEGAYKAALAIDPKSTDAIAGLTNVYLATQRLPEAESALRKFIALEPASSSARIQLGRVLARSGKLQDAINELEAGAGAQPDPKLTRELAGLYLAAKKADKAAAAFQSLLPAMANDFEVHYGLGKAFLELLRYDEAQAAFIQAVKLNPRMPDAYADLALAASNNKQYELAIRALDARASIIQDNPATYFLRATCYDNLKMYKEAASNYRLFLQVAGGRFADQEWQAKHRLIAIEPKSNH